MFNYLKKNVNGVKRKMQNIKKFKNPQEKTQCLKWKVHWLRLRSDETIHTEN